jgi:hypothetical protein
MAWGYTLSEYPGWQEQKRLHPLSLLFFLMLLYDPYQIRID